MHAPLSGRPRRVRAAGAFASGLAAIALSVTVGAGTASATDTTPPASPEPSTSASVSPSPSESVSPSASASPSASESPSSSPSTSPSPSESPKPSETPSPTPSCEDEAVTVHGRIWHDKNKNGIQDAGEPGLANIPLLALDSDDIPVRGAKTLPDAKVKAELKAATPEADDGFPGVFTDKDGRYEFTGLKPGPIGVALFPVTVVNDEAIAEWKLSPPDQGNDATKDSDFHPEEDFGFLEFEGAPCDTVTADGGLFNDEDGAPATVTPSPTSGGGDGGGSLPNTGLAIGGFLVVGTALIGGGIALTVMARKRRSTV